MDDVVIVGLARVDAETENVEGQLTGQSQWMFLLRHSHSDLLRLALEKLDSKIKQYTDMVITCSTVEDSYAREHCYLNERCRPRYVMNALGVTTTSLLNAQLPSLGRLFKIDTACSSGISALEIAVDRAASTNQLILITGVDKSTTPMFSKLFHMIGALATGPEPYNSPFSTNRNGFAMGEGAAAMAVTSRTRAEKLGLPILARIDAVKNKTIFTHPTEPSDSKLLSLLIQETITQSNRNIQEIACWDAHATATPSGDAREFEIFQNIAGNSNMFISSFKSRIGHCMSASAVIEIANAISCLKAGTVSPNYNLKNPISTDPRLITTHTPTDKKTFIKTSFGFGGQNGVAVITVY